MIYPTIHLNGTSKQELIDKLCAACTAVQEASYAVSDAAPNGRDYYTQGDGAFAKAQAEHAARLNMLAEVHSQLEAIALHIDGGN